jgi:hypothetical protein
MKHAILVIAAMTLVGCGTISSQTVEYCDTDTRTFIGIPFSSTSDCMGVSNSANGTGITVPPAACHTE